MAVNWPAARPVPDRGTIKVGFDALEVMVMLPAMEPDVAGENMTPKLALWPAASVNGKLKPLRTKLELALAAEIVRLAPPELVSVCIRL